MRWDAVLEVWLDAAYADEDVQSVLGPDPTFVMAGERDHAVPSAEYTIVVPGILWLEVYERTDVQLDYFVETLEQLVTLTRALRRLYHHDLPITLGGVRLWSQLTRPRSLPGAKDGTHNGSLDFQLTYLRSKYA